MIILTPDSEGYEDFYVRLTGPEGCDFSDASGKFTWKCSSSSSDNPHEFARKILATFDGVDVDGTIAGLVERGGHCDCEIAFNCEPEHEFSFDEDDDDDEYESI